MPPTILDKQRSTANVNQVRRFIDLKKEIVNLDTSDIPLVILLSQIQRKQAFDSKFRWLEDQYVPQVTKADGVQLAADTTFEVTAGTGKYFRPNDLVFVPASGEVMSVTSILVDALTVARGWGATNGVDVQDQEEIVILGIAMEEGSGAPEIRTTVEGEVYNFIQTFKWAFELTNEWGDEVDELAEDDKAYQRQKALEEHLQRIEWQLWFGVKNEDLGDTSKPRRSTGGVNEFIVTNELDVSGGGGTLTEPDFINLFLEPAFAKGGSSGTKWLFAAPRVHSVISQFAAPSIRVSPDDKLFGIKIMQYESAHGTTNLIQHRRFRTFSVGQKMGFLLDMNLMALKVLRDTYRKDNIQANDNDTEKDVYITKCGLMLENEAAHARLEGVTG